MTTEDQRRYTAAAHAMQSGVAYEMNYDHAPTDPKHLRVGINSALSSLAGLAELLIGKGLITRDELEAAIADAMEEEVETYSKRISDHLGGVRIDLV